MVSVDPVILNIAILSLVALLIGMVLRYYNQPSVIAYILTGIILGPYGFHLLRDNALVSHLGNIGVVLLLFFAGMEISIDGLIRKWRIAIIGTFFQIMISVLVVYILGHYLGWPVGRSVLIGFVISLSSTAVVLNIIQNRNELGTKTGQDVLSILLIQDIAVIPMIIVISLLSGNAVNPGEVLLQVIGGILSVLFVIWLVYKKHVSLPFGSRIRQDHELQVLAAFILCFGIAVVTGLFQLSTALGAFLAGVFLASARETEWVHNSLHSFKVIFIAVFFLSIGMLIDLRFLWDNLALILVILFFVYLMNTLINAIVFRLNGRTWRESFYGGSLLAQIGEFSFILAAIGLQTGIIAGYSYQITIEVIALSLIVSPFWIGYFCRFMKRARKLYDKTLKHAA
ncbi:MAG: cation:proton antiporter [archaeon]